MRIQNTVIGRDRKVIVRLTPKPVHMNPNVNEPHIAPIDVMDAIQEI